jgi:hypothetical protein
MGVCIQAAFVPSSGRLSEKRGPLRSGSLNEQGERELAHHPDHTYGHHHSVIIANRRIDWLPLTHPGNRTPAWRARHTRWTTTATL